MTEQVCPTPRAARAIAYSTRPAIRAFLNGIRVAYPSVLPDHSFERTCKASLIQRKCATLLPYLSAGVAMSTTAYAHLPSIETRIFIALYTAFLVYLDDVFEQDVNGVRLFNDKFVNKQVHVDVNLRAFDELLREVPRHWEPMISNIIVTSTLNLVTALLLEHETQGVAMARSAVLFPTFSRVMSGASEAYALFMFPSGIPAVNFVQALPHVMRFINDGNDVLSFYKEELAGELVNRISLLASLTASPKSELLRQLVDEAVESHSCIVEILSNDQDSLKAYTEFSRGYVGFHAALNRYRLNELLNL